MTLPQPTPTAQTRRVTVIRDGDLFRWRLQRSPVNRTTSTTPFVTFARALQAAQSVAACYGAELAVAL